MKRYDGIALAGALGALAGLSVAIVNAWEIIPTILSAVVCVVVAGVAYRPLEIPMVVVNACRALPGALRSTPQWFGVRKEQLKKGCSTTLLVIGCIALGVISFLAIPVFLYVCGVLLHIPDKDGQNIGVGYSIFMTGAVAGVGGLLVTIYLLVVNNSESPRWAWRMGKVFDQFFKEAANPKKNTKPTKGEYPLIYLCTPVFLELMSIGIIMFLLDALYTLLLALASTERIAAILSAFLGWGTGVVLHMCGVPGDLFLLAIGGIGGWFAGPLLYRLREYLAAVPATATP